MKPKYITKYPQAEEALGRLLDTVYQLRSPGGCPWDQKQTHQSLRRCLVEETCEVLDVLDRIQRPEDLGDDKLKGSLQEELGDLLLQVLFHAQLASEGNYFSIENVLNEINQKLIRRHPHVFGPEGKKTDSTEIALQYWEKEKQKEKPQEASILDGLPKTLSALQQASSTLQKASQLGFPWEEVEALFFRLQFKLTQWKEALVSLKNSFQENRDLAQEQKFGDFLLDLCAMASFLSISTEDALRNSVSQFQKKLRYVERHTRLSPKKDPSLLWEEATVFQAIEVWGLTGGVASGKSEIAKLFAASGVFVVDADAISRKLLEQKDLCAEVQKKFGVSDRSELRKLIFSDAQARKELEALLHPKIRQESFNCFKNAIFLKKKVVIYEASLLIETGAHEDLAGLIVVEAPESLRLERLIKRDGISMDLAKNMVAAQLSDASRRSYASEVIKNIASFHDLQLQVSDLMNKKNWVSV